MQPVVNYVISLNKNNDKRKAHISNQFQKKNIPFQFFDAVTPNINLQISQHCGINLKDLNLTDTEISCMLSHIQIWKKMIDENLDIIGVFEDDIYLSDDSSTFLKNYDWVKKNTHVIKIEKGFQNTFKTTPFNSVKLSNGYKLFKLKSHHYGAAGYILTQEGARFLLRKFKTSHKVKAVDVEIFGKLLNDNSYSIFQMSPTLCIQEFILKNEANCQLGSSLEIDRRNHLKLQNQNQNQNQRSLIKKIHREINRPFYQLYNWCFKKIFFKALSFKPK